MPGQPTEEAAAEVASEAGKSLLRGIAKLGDAYVAKWTAAKEAQAEAARLAIETASRIEADAMLVKARRDQEMAELEHQAVLERRLQRLRGELAREQQNLEAVERRALEFTEADPANGSARDIDEDWLFRFADFAQKVSDRDVQNLWARALSSAAIDGLPRLSAAALQTLGLFDGYIAEDFKKFVTVIVRVGFMPHPPSGHPLPQPLDIAALTDLGLIKELVTEGPLALADFSFQPQGTATLGTSLRWPTWS
ncbi:DUF2806 domain-containing protein [Bradyrhizobium sp. USDA 4472]